MVQPFGQGLLLLRRAPLDPAPVAKHQDIGTADTVTAGTAGNIAGPHGHRVNGNLFLIGPNGIGAGRKALQPVD